MSFNIALSGVNASQKDLDTTANNIANVNTVGFKESRAEFADVYAASLLSSGRTKVGDGVITSDVAQQFNQGAIEFTQNALDLAITGNGFFSTVPDISSREFSYTRAGMFKLNDENFVVDSNGNHLLGFPVNPDGSSASVALSTANPLQIPDSSGSPTPSSEVDMKMNLPANDAYITGAPATFDPTDQTTYNAATSVTIYDSLGEAHIQTMYFVKKDPATNPNEWTVFTTIDGVEVNVVSPAAGPIPAGNTGASGIQGAQLNFDSSGNFTGQFPTPANGGIVTEQLGPAGANVLINGSDPTQTILIDFNLDTVNTTADEPTQFASSFEVTRLEQNGLAVGRLTGIDIGPDGLVRATYSNGTSQPLARIALARFPNEQGLTQIGNTSWQESQLSGEALSGEAGSGTFGTIQSSALEAANVNLTNELIDLIEAQRNFQANSRSLEVNNQLNQTILQIR